MELWQIVIGVALGAIVGVAVGYWLGRREPRRATVRRVVPERVEMGVVALEPLSAGQPVTLDSAGYARAVDLEAMPEVGVVTEHREFTEEDWRRVLEWARGRGANRPDEENRRADGG